MLTNSNTSGDLFGHTKRNSEGTSMNNGKNKKSDILQAALRYAEELSFSVIPVGKDKKPLIKWESFQKRKAVPAEIQDWWQKWPDANIGIVTGVVSNLAVIDIDTEEGKKAVQELVPDSLTMPACTTPKGGQHLYFQCPDDKLKNNTKIVTGCDLRANGGYVVAPPSVNGSGKGYIWLPGLSPFDVLSPALPLAYIEYINKNAVKKVGGIEVDESVVTPMFENGHRDDGLFRTANSLVKGGMTSPEIFQVLENLIISWGEKPDPKWINEKIQSALKRVSVREKSLSEEVKDWVLSSNGVFMSSEVVNCLHLSSREEKKNLSKILSRLCEEGVIEKYGNKNGCYRQINNACDAIDWRNAPTESIDIKWPFEIERLVKVMPKNIIVLAGASNSGKTAFLLNVVRNNMRQHDIHYFSSEMGDIEFRDRLSKFDIPLTSWQFKAKERASDFADVIQPDAVNIIDFLELHEDFFKVGGYIKEIYDKLNKGIAIIALQKNAGQDHGLGGQRSIEKARLYLAMDYGRIRIIKGKNWANPTVNPNGLELHFKLVHGCNFIIEQDWLKS